MKQQTARCSLAGTVNIPASKSHTIRALIFASLAEGKSIIEKPLDSGDARSCIAACRALGAEINEEGGSLVINGTGLDLKAPPSPIDVGNSGTTLYLLTSAAALSDREISFTGDSQIQRRSAAQLLHSLSDLGAGVNVAKNNGCAPYTIKGPLKGGKTSIECPTSQFLSSLLIACPLADGNTEIQVPLLHEKPYAEMTLRWLDDQFVMYENKNFSSFFIPGGQKYRPFSKPVPADFSSATFFLCAAAITRSKLRLKNLDMKDSQGDKEVVRILEKMGCAVSFDGMDIIIEGRPMQGIDIDLNSMPDALPALAAAACFAEGTTRLLNVPQARMKETDRIAVMFSELLKMGADITELPDGLVIKKSSLKGTEVHGHDDHRVVMALAIAGLGADGVTVIGTAEAAAVTFPGFFETLESIKV